MLTCLLCRPFLKQKQDMIDEVVDRVEEVADQLDDYVQDDKED